MTRRDFTPDPFARRLLALIAVLLGVIAVELWGHRPGMLPSANAQIPDTALQRQEIVRETQKTNKLLAEILQHLRSKPVKVRMLDADEADKGRRRGVSGPGRNR